MTTDATELHEAAKNLRILREFRLARNSTAATPDTRKTNQALSVAIAFIEQAIDKGDG